MLAWMCVSMCVWRECLTHVCYVWRGLSQEIVYEVEMFCVQVQHRNQRAFENVRCLCKKVGNA
jgi:hypothetical protein